MTNVIKDGWEIIPKNTQGLYAFSDDEYFEENFKEEYPLVYKEQRIVQDMLKLFIPGEYGYYFSETHEHDEPEDIPHGKGVWKTVYYTPVAFYSKAGEYNIIETVSTEDYIYYAISLHGSGFASALTEYVRVARQSGGEYVNQRGGVLHYANGSD